MPPSTRARALARAGLGLLGGLLVGVAAGVAGVAVHGRWWGLALTVAAVAATCTAFPAGAPRLGFAGGFVGLVALAARAAPEGGYLVAADAPGYVLAGLGLLVLVGAGVTLPSPRPGPRRGP